MNEKNILYSTTNTYVTLNEMGTGTKNVWVVFHGIGYLSRYFLRHFKDLVPEENYIIAPQAPAKYYLSGAYKHLGASWLTRENTVQETQNVFRYLDAVWEAENVPYICNLIVLGFSQGVSIATRWVAHKKLPIYKLILYAGTIPNELKPSDFDFLKTREAQVQIVTGENDTHITQEKLSEEYSKAKILFGGRIEVITFEGGHEVKKEVINRLV